MTNETPRRVNIETKIVRIQSLCLIALKKNIKAINNDVQVKKQSELTYMQKTREKNNWDPTTAKIY